MKLHGKKKERQSTSSDAQEHSAGYCVECMAPELSPHPEAAFITAIESVANSMRSNPCVPGPFETAFADEPRRADGQRLPRKHCAFRACRWTGDTDSELLKHVEQAHCEAAGPLQTAVDRLGRGVHSVRHPSPCGNRSL